MKYYTLEELKESIEACLNKGLRDRENSYIEAISYCCVIFESDFEYGETEKNVLPLLIGSKVLENSNRLFIGQYKMFENASKEIMMKVSQFDLTEEEKLEVIELANVIIGKLPKVQVEHDSKAK